MRISNLNHLEDGISKVFQNVCLIRGFLALANLDFAKADTQ